MNKFINKALVWEKSNFMKINKSFETNAAKKLHTHKNTFGQQTDVSGIRIYLSLYP